MSTGIQPEDCNLVILASGRSKRFGPADKLLAPFLGKPLCTHIIDTLAPIDFAGRFAVLPEDCPERTAHFVSAGYQAISNTQPEKGHGHSIMLAAQALTHAKHICIVLADMPLIESEHILTLLSHPNTAIIMSEYDGIPMPPAIFPPAFLPELSTSSEARKRILKTSRPQTIALSKHAAQDIDTIADLHELEVQIRY